MDQVAEHDALILGAGLAGFRAAVELGLRTGGKTSIGIVSKVQLMRAHSVCAEGGTGAVMRSEAGDSLELHAWDTIKGSDFLADQDVVERFVSARPGEIRLLEHWGACMAADKTGFFEMQALYDTLLRSSPVLLLRVGRDCGSGSYRFVAR